jgi:hypothetical protein
MEDLCRVVETEAMPPRAPASHCRDCGYRKICVRPRKGGIVIALMTEEAP